MIFARLYFLNFWMTLRNCCTRILAKVFPSLEAMHPLHFVARFGNVFFRVARCEIPKRLMLHLACQLCGQVTIASRLSAEMGHVRVDLFLTDDGPCEKSVVLGELTYASTGGREWFHPREIENDMAMLWNVVSAFPCLWLYPHNAILRHDTCTSKSRRSLLGFLEYAYIFERGEI